MGQLQKVSWRAVGYSALGTVLAAASVVAIVNSDGVRPTSLTSNAATRWLVDRVNDTAVLVDGLAGRVVARIQTESEAGDEVAVQGAGGAFLVAKGEGSLRTISTSKLQLGTAQAVGLLLQPDVVLGVGASGLTIVSPDADQASVVAVDDATRPIKIPSATDSYVAADGSMWLLDGTVATHVNVDQTFAAVLLRSAPDQTITIGASRRRLRQREQHGALARRRRGARRLDSQRQRGGAATVRRGRRVRVARSRRQVGMCRQDRHRSHAGRPRHEHQVRRHVGSGRQCSSHRHREQRDHSHRPRGRAAG